MRSFPVRLVLAVVAVGLSSAMSAFAAPFTYQGLLKDSSGGAAAYDFRVTVFEAQNDDNVAAGPLLFDDVAVEGGRFTLVIEVGTAVFNGTERWLEIGVRRGNETGAYTTLTPRQRVHAAPYAQHADDADFAAEVAAGSVTATQINATSVQRRVAGACGASQAIRQIDEDGGVQCVENGDITDVVAGAGLQGGASFGSAMLSIDSAIVQTRVLNSCAAGQAIEGIGQNGATTCVTVPTHFWSRQGNVGTSPVTDFLGTTDGQPFEIRTQNRRHLRIEPSAALASGAPITANIIAGSHGNAVSTGVRGATIAGGGTPQFVNDPDLGYGDPNLVASHYGTVGGGLDNRAGGESAFSFGNFPFATVGGGVGNLASANSATIGGGFSNSVYGYTATVAGGATNTAWGSNSSVPGGVNNCAGGMNSFAAGTGAAVRPGSDPGIGGACGSLASYANNGDSGDQGTFVWADASGGRFLSSGNNRFEVRATGGVRFVTGINASGVPDAGVKLDADDNAWEVLSDRQAKAGIQTVAPEDVLARLLALPIYTWHYTSQGAATQHIGPMAQDFHAAFGFNGNDDRHISTLDPDGVALAAIQGLHAHFAALREADTTRIARLESDNADLRATLRTLVRRLQTLERATRDR